MAAHRPTLSSASSYDSLHDPFAEGASSRQPSRQPSPQPPFAPQAPYGQPNDSSAILWPGSDHEADIDEELEEKQPLTARPGFSGGFYPPQG